MRLSGVRALVVEADSSNAKLLVVLLRTEGADARSAPSAESALPLVTSFRPQLVITEIVLPGMNGLSFARELRRNDAELCIVVVTSKNGPSADAESRAAGANAYFQKPIDTNDFVSRLVPLLTIKDPP